MKWIDMPPVWLAFFVVLAWLQSSYLTFGLALGAWADFVGGLLVGGGILLALLAFMEFRKHRTTVVPHNTPERLITSGIFTRTRNPIYLGDVLILMGLILRWDAVLSLPLVPVFLWILEKRFIEPEETRMRQAFRAEFAKYERKVRRWV
ncbi:methyltransferase family protein [Roseovarius sp. 2305UL8-3]|uniref:methyltransferase family protein n=1 Tax=Roseovarius conchicola TaxID=3121636 RepID=UPI0035275DAF